MPRKQKKLPIYIQEPVKKAKRETASAKKSRLEVESLLTDFTKITGIPATYNAEKKIKKIEYPMKIKVSDYVVQFIVEQGIKHLFMVPGGGAMHLNDSVGKNKNLEFISNHHEQASAMAAETYARISDNLGVAFVTTGPGGTNAVTGVAGAWLDSTSCLFISGQVKRADLIGDLGVRQNGVQEIGIVDIVKSITKYAATIMEPDSIRNIINGKGEFYKEH